jgi:hypothetical protein
LRRSVVRGRSSRFSSASSSLPIHLPEPHLFDAGCGLPVVGAVTGKEPL